MTEQFKKNLLTISGLLVVMWMVHLVNLFLPWWDFRNWGIRPRVLNGLWGILFGPFLHADFFHLLNNSIPLLILGLTFLNLYREHFVDAFVLILLVEGVLVWLFARNATHIGASGLIFGLISYLITFGFLRKQVIPIAVSIIVAFYYGGTLLWGVLPTAPYLSWEGHLSGAIGGIVAALLTRDEEKRIKRQGQEQAWNDVIFLAVPTCTADQHQPRLIPDVHFTQAVISNNTPRVPLLI